MDAEAVNFSALLNDLYTLMGQGVELFTDIGQLQGDKAAVAVLDDADDLEAKLVGVVKAFRTRNMSAVQAAVAAVQQSAAKLAKDAAALQSDPLVAKITGLTAAISTTLTRILADFQN